MKNLGNVFILGDSYSTFEGHIPEGCWTWYYSDKRTGTDVGKVEETWWHMLISHTESNLLMNCSFSGTTICNKCNDGEDCSKKSFIGRFEKLCKDGFWNENKVDTFIIFGGTNDSWLNSPIGAPKYNDWSTDDLDATLPAVSYLISKVIEVCNPKKIVFILNTDMKPEIKNGYIAACNHYGIGYIELKNIDKINGHPSVSGMKQIEAQIFDYL